MSDGAHGEGLTLQAIFETHSPRHPMYDIFTHIWLIFNDFLVNEHVSTDTID